MRVGWSTCGVGGVAGATCGIGGGLLYEVEGSLCGIGGVAVYTCGIRGVCCTGWRSRGVGVFTCGIRGDLGGWWRGGCLGMVGCSEMGGLWESCCESGLYTTGARGGEASSSSREHENRFVRLSYRIFLRLHSPLSKPYHLSRCFVRPVLQRMASRIHCPLPKLSASSSFLRGPRRSQHTVMILPPSLISHTNSVRPRPHTQLTSLSLSLSPPHPPTHSSKICLLRSGLASKTLLIASSALSNTFSPIGDPPRPSCIYKRPHIR